MLLNLHVKNIALIDDVELDFGEGLNILTGETGAGKSILIDSINFALGKRMKADTVRDDAEYALCELTFSADSDEVRAKLDELDIPRQDDCVVLQRRIMKGRNTIRINGESASTAVLKELAGVLIDIHGQHEHQSLLYPDRQREMLDNFCRDELGDLPERLAKAYDEHALIEKELNEALAKEGGIDKEKELAGFEVDEILSAALSEGEDEILEAEYRKLSNSRAILEAVEYAHSCSGYEGDSGAGSLIGRALGKLKSVEAYDEALAPLIRELTDIDGLLNDFNRSVAAYNDDLDDSQGRFEEVEQRLNIINRIKARYGGSIEKVNEYLEEKQKMLERYLDYDNYLLALKEKHDKARDEMTGLADKISAIRKKEAAVLSGKLKEALYDLNFLDARFEIGVSQDKDHIGRHGYDGITFLISTNPGEKLRPLKDVASGGELSRVMLAFKSVLADRDDIKTLIFDEIDAGISGRTAQKVSEKLKRLSKDKQVICITHLPQIAAMADMHFEISKGVEGTHTRTEVKLLDGDEAVMELARMLGGAMITESVINNAKEMKMLADSIR
ncbi:MAG: DNA repair protein RecN [Lachnospiraceae bacterium]|nr:DNA repair protein RecN [Lachnospiraceae bacterium]